MSMNRETELLLQSGISAVRSGDKREGARLLAQVVRKEPQSEDAWFWLAAATDQPTEAAACLRRVLAINPNNQRAKQALGVLESGQNVDAFNTALDAPNNAPPPGMRSLNTGELLAPPNFGEQPIASQPPPPPPPFGASPGFTNDYGAPTTPPPPPFGAALTEAGNSPPRPPLPNDPYSSVPMSASSGIPASSQPQFTGGGLRLGQLDPNAPPPPPMMQAAPINMDPGSDLRARLLTNAPNENVPVVPVITSNTPRGRRAKKGVAVAGAPAVIVNNQTVVKKRRNLLPLLLAILVLFIAAAAALLYFKGPGTNITTLSTTNGVAGTDATSTANAAASAGVTAVAGSTGSVDTTVVGGASGSATTATGVNGATNVAGVNGATNVAGVNGATTVAVNSGSLANSTPIGGGSVIGGATTASAGVGTSAAQPSLVAANPATATAIAGTANASGNGGGAGNLPTPASGVATSGNSSTNANPNQATIIPAATPVGGSNLTPGTLPPRSAVSPAGATATAQANSRAVVTTAAAGQTQVTPGAPTPTGAPQAFPTVANPTSVKGGEPNGVPNPNTTPGLNPLATPTPSSLAPNPEVLKYVAETNTNFSYAQFFQMALNEGIIKPYLAGRIRPGVTRINIAPVLISTYNTIPLPAFVAAGVLDSLTGVQQPVAPNGSAGTGSASGATTTAAATTPAIGGGIGSTTAAATSAPANNSNPNDGGVATKAATAAVTTPAATTAAAGAATTADTSAALFSNTPAPKPVLVLPPDVIPVIMNGPNGPALYYYLNSTGLGEVSQLSISLGRMARIMKDQPVPADAYELNQVALEYAQDIAFMSNDLDRFFQTGQVSYLDDMTTYYQKSLRDQQRWQDIVNAGFPFKIKL